MFSSQIRGYLDVFRAFGRHLLIGARISLLRDWRLFFTFSDDNTWCVFLEPLPNLRFLV
jgi:hypothetical protein